LVPLHEVITGLNGNAPEELHAAWHQSIDRELHTESACRRVGGASFPCRTSAGTSTHGQRCCVAGADRDGIWMKVDGQSVPGHRLGWHRSANAKDLVEMLPDEHLEISRIDAHTLKLQRLAAGQARVEVRCFEELVEYLGHPSED
jgi:hypothetical protein